MSIEGTTATALIGARSDRGGIGAAWVFTRSGTTWTQQGAKLTAKSPEEVGSGEFGASVALSVEGTTMTALIGAPGDNERIGAAWVFTRTGTTWTQQGAKLVAKSGEETGAGEFGFSVALLAKEGTTALIGAPSDKEQIGAAWAFTRSGTTWSQQGAKLVAKSGEEIGKGEFGDSVAMSIESTTVTALVGARGDKGGIGAAFVFTRSGTTWAQQGAKLVAKSGEETGTGAFGSGVALAVEGTTTTALIGAGQDNSGIGAAWVFTRSGTTWTQQGAKLVAKSGEETGNGFFGSERGAVHRKHDHDRAHRCPPRQHRRRCGVGVHALGHDVDPAGDEAHRENPRRVRQGRIWRLGRTARQRRQQPRCSARPATTMASAARGSSRARARPGASRVKSSPRKAAKRPAKKNRPAKARSDTAWRSPPKGPRR